jgi:hypothetical protein
VCCLYTRNNIRMRFKTNTAIRSASAFVIILTNEFDWWEKGLVWTLLPVLGFQTEADFNLFTFPGNTRCRILCLDEYVREIVKN